MMIIDSFSKLNLIFASDELGTTQYTHVDKLDMLNLRILGARRKARIKNRKEKIRSIFVNV